ncbi:dual specificity protein phosphatase 12 [Micropterus dolomieu]|uniref:dual specificity protein phosphatase 12 n=1 Tax=Micropterus dolomieu TaxID=147949 RepID=UPI001E8E93C8|nr:dual specificity protein phosphatase 12 [Micropterus dolomieu]
MLLVDPGLYIGTAADLNDRQALADAAVTHVLSVDSVDPAPLLPADAVRCRKWINVLDEVTSDLLSHMDDSFQFIQQAVDAGKAALVHCQAGRSRSATIVTAYLMKRYQLGFTEAYHRLRSVKQDVQVNRGFEEQLCLYEAMKCEVDTSSSLYKQYRLTKITEKYPGEIQCTSYFIEPVQWMEQALLGVMDGQLLCPKCSSKLGSFSWCGDQCSCGRWVTPAFQLHRNRVDEIQQVNIHKVNIQK